MNPLTTSSFSTRRLKYVVTLRRSRAQGNENRKPYIGLEHIESWTGRLVSDLSSADEAAVLATGESETLSSTFEPGDVLFGKLRPYLAKAWVAEFAGRCTTEALVMQPVAAEARFLHYVCLCPNFIELVDASTFGSKMPRAEWEFIGNIKIPVPPLPQQRAIADYLDRETGRIDALIAAKERLLALLVEKRRALITRAVTRGLDPNAPMKDSGIPWLGEIPAHWEIRQLKFVAINLQTGPFGTQLHAGEYITGGVPVVNPAHLKAGKIVTDERMTIDDVTAERLAIHRLKPGDLVLARRGEIGRCAVVEPAQAGWLCGTGSLRARLRREVANPYYLALMFSHTLVSDTLVLESVGSTMDNLNTEILGSCRLPIPPLDEQRAIVEHITEETARLDTLRAATERSIALLKERRAALISAAVTGQIDVPACAASTADREAVP